MGANQGHYLIVKEVLIWRAVLAQKAMSCYNEAILRRTKPSTLLTAVGEKNTFSYKQQRLLPFKESN